MQGNNLIRQQAIDPLGRLWVQKVFAGTQNDGTPSVFVSLAGCNLQCSFCYVDFESAFNDEASFAGVEPLTDSINHLVMENPGCNNVVITGGEPFRQNFIPLASNLISIGYTVEVETAGTLFIESFHKIASNCHVTVSPKTPKINESIETVADAYKYVISVLNSDAGNSVFPMDEKRMKLPMPKFGQPIFLQPMDCQDKEVDALNTKAALNMSMQTGWKLSTETRHEPHEWGFEIASVRKITHQEVFDRCNKVAGMLKDKFPVRRELTCYPVPVTGVAPAYALGEALAARGITLQIEDKASDEADFVLDSVAHTGATTDSYAEYAKLFIALFSKCPDDEDLTSDEWLVFPWEKSS